MTAGKTRIAILGGGCGGMTAAFWLTSTQALRDRFEVTVYQRGWRLGGKGSSGRNAECASRVEEHGLHMWLGCYENALRTLRACFDEWRPSDASPVKTWRDAFAPQYQITFAQQESQRDDAWSLWDFTMPARGGTPGDGTPLYWADRLLALADWLGARLHPAAGAPDFVQRLLAWLVFGAICVGTFAAMILRVLVAGVTLVLRSIARTRRAARFSILADLGLTAIIGVARDILPYGTSAFERLNEYDFREWLARHGALEATTDSAPVRAIYDLGFAYPNGDASSFRNGRGAAGAGLRFLLEWGLSYKGAPLWKMSAGMGDIVFTPLYQVLRARGVDFRFFHEVVRINPSANGKRVESVVVRRQAEVVAEPYRPLVSVKGLESWPSEPLWDQLVDGDKLASSGVDFEFWSGPADGKERTLAAGTDFEHVVLAFPPEMVRCVAPALSDSNSAWKAMIDNSAAVATQAFQLWLHPSLCELGWPSGPTVLSAYAPPFDTWADMSHLIPMEDWPAEDPPATIAYFCGVLAGERSSADDVKRNAEQWLLDNAGFVWRRRFRKGAKPDPGLIVAGYFRCNVDPSERYVQTLPGSVRYRLAPGSRTFENLLLAGDWTKTRYSSGSVESAVESGMLAAQAICGEPAHIYGASSRQTASDC